MGWQTRTPTSNDPPKVEVEEVTWVQEALDDVIDITCLLLWGRAKRCTKCRVPALLKYLKDGKCPTCREEVITTPSGYRGHSIGGYDGEAD